ncbi:hypothetical protein K431DRAFT_280597 [Polychaeton citri CBS 116435]|uniref:Uncharacterized protein n=1 Tax=Polychaeton citri CBS 116435 TaxID=1314669 RepID=A0A9P4QEN0_9PEZI|nr:hypothetical protein K431DRAFT_280597 [Polychaeton citri CBS 116435]
MDATTVIVFVRSTLQVSRIADPTTMGSSQFEGMGCTPARRLWIQYDIGPCTRQRF